MPCRLRLRLGRSAAAAVAGIAIAAPVSAQIDSNVRASVLHESYGLGEGFGLDRISESSLAVTMVTTLARGVSLTAATGFATVSSTTAGGGEGASVSGLLDTELRLSLGLFRDRLLVFATGRLPTGMESLDSEDSAALPLLANDLIGFASPTLGTGGGTGGGAAFAVPVGGISIGLSASVRSAFAYSPFPDSDSEFAPGTELRVRAGLDGPVGQGTFLRVSGMFIGGGGAEIGGTAAEIGNRFSGTLSLEQGVGPATLTLYVFDLYRTDGGLQETPLGVGFLPEGNTFAGGALYSYPLSTRTQITPRVEFRDSRRASAVESDSLERFGSSTRFGVDVRREFSSAWAGVARAEGLTGSFAQGENDISVSGFRVSAHLEFAP